MSTEIKNLMHQAINCQKLKTGKQKQIAHWNIPVPLCTFNYLHINIVGLFPDDNIFTYKIPVIENIIVFLVSIFDRFTVNHILNNLVEPIAKVLLDKWIGTYGTTSPNAADRELEFQFTFL